MKPNAEIPVSVELLRMIFDMPSDYQIVGAYTRVGEECQTVRLLVAARGLPNVATGARHELTPRFQRAETGKATLERVDVRYADPCAPATASVCWDGEDGG